MKEKNVHLDEETREDKAESRLVCKKALSAECPRTREECLYV